MFIGIIRTKDILLNPRTIISMRGVKGFMKLVYRALRRKPYSFIGMTQESDWIFDQKIHEKIAEQKRREMKPAPRRRRSGKAKKRG